MRTGLVILAVALAACASSKAAGTGPSSGSGGGDKSLYDRLGGKPAIEAVIDEFLARVAQDEKINASFAAAHLPRLKQRLVEQVCQAAGGPCVYSGRDMKTVHAGMGITAEQFTALVGDLVGALDKFNVPEAEKGALLSVLGPMQKDIVEEP